MVGALWGAVLADGDEAASVEKEWPLKVSFRNRREIRMGSPHQVCDLVLSGSWRPELERGDWQGLKAASPDGRYLGLVRWDTRGNTPGFRVVVLDTGAQRVFRSRRFSGCCRSIAWNNGVFAWATSSARSGQYTFLPAKKGS